MDFQADYQEIKATGTELLTQAREYNSEVAAIYKKVDEVSNGWQGADNKAFATQVTSYKSTMEDLGAAIEECGTFLKNVADVIEETQRNISEAAGRI